MSPRAKSKSKDTVKKPYVVTAPNIFVKADPPGSGNALSGTHNRVPIGTTLMLTDLEAKQHVNKVLSPQAAVAARAYERAKAAFDELGLQPQSFDGPPVDWPSVEPQLPST